MVDEGSDVGLECIQASFASERFVVAEESEDDIGLGVGQFKSVLANFVLIAGGEFVRLRARSRAC